jgi:hypothetical protein
VANLADGTFVNDLNATLANIDAVRTPSRFLNGADDGGRLATYGGTGVYSGGAYDAFRRSDDIEDRRRQKYSQNPAAPPEIVGREQGTDFDYYYLSSVIQSALGVPNNSALSIAAGINDIKQ